MELFAHIRIVLGMIISLGLTHMLKGISGYIQHPSRRIYPVHAAWVGSVVLQILHFWWWEFSLRTIPGWNFGIFAFLILYAFLIYLQCAMLFPDKLDGNETMRTYFLSRRRWFFGLLLAICLADVVDSEIKGVDYVDHLSTFYWIRSVAVGAGCLWAMKTTREYFHYAFVVATVASQLVLISMSYWHSQ